MFLFYVVYSMSAAGSLNPQLACRQSVVIGWKLQRRSNSVMADTSHFEISVGDMFSSFRELEDKIKEFLTYSFTQLWMRDARTLAAASKRTPKRVQAVNADVKYYSVYCCIHRGKTFKSSGHGQRQTS